MSEIIDLIKLYRAEQRRLMHERDSNSLEYHSWIWFNGCVSLLA